MAIITYTVATGGYYDILVSGAAGGGGFDSNVNTGGLGASEQARFYFTSGTTLEINVGTAGTAPTNSYGGGGGCYLLPSRHPDPNHPR